MGRRSQTSVRCSTLLGGELTRAEAVGLIFSEFEKPVGRTLRWKLLSISIT